MTGGCTRWVRSLVSLHVLSFEWTEPLNNSGAVVNADTSALQRRMHVSVLEHAARLKELRGLDRKLFWLECASGASVGWMLALQESKGMLSWIINIQNRNSRCKNKNMIIAVSLGHLKTPGGLCYKNFATTQTSWIHFFLQTEKVSRLCQFNIKQNNKNKKKVRVENELHNVCWKKKPLWRRWFHFSLLVWTCRICTCVNTVLFQ